MNSIEIKKLSLNFGEIEVLKELDLSIEKGEFLVLLGASGCGKSTLLNCIAGLLDVTDGQIFINEQNVTWYEPAQRGIGMVFQSYALYPQMTVKGNLSFGLKNAGLPKEEIEKRVKHASEILQIESLLERKPAALSGGQRQRVAIGRALVRDVEVFLFDEPLSNLDAKLRNELRVEIKRLHQKLDNTMIYVTHDQIEAMTLADKIVVLRLGIIEQVGAPMDLYRDPDNKFVAGFIGSPAMNFVNGTAKRGGVDAPGLGLHFDGIISTAHEGKAVSVGARPEHITLDPAGDTHTVEMTESLGGVSFAYLSGPTGERIVVEERGDERTAAGVTVGINIETSRILLFDAETEMRIRS